MLLYLPLSELTFFYLLFFFPVSGINYAKSLLNNQKLIVTGKIIVDEFNQLVADVDEAETALGNKVT